MDTNRPDRGHQSRSDTPEPPSPPCYGPNQLDHSKKSHRHSPSPDRRSGKTSRNPSSERNKKRRSTSKQRSPMTTRKRSRSNERSRKHSKRDRTPTRSRKDRSRDRRKSRSRSFSKSSTNSRSRSRSRSRGRRERDRHRERRHHRSPDSEHHGDHSDQLQRIVQLPPGPPAQSNAFANDGSFMEMFKKMQEQMQPVQKPTTSALEEKPAAPPPLMVGKRRGGRILKTGMVAKPKTEEKGDQPKDAWSLYMAEVKKYREVCCQEEDNTRPLVK